MTNDLYCSTDGCGDFENNISKILSDISTLQNKDLDQDRRLDELEGYDINAISIQSGKAIALAGQVSSQATAAIITAGNAEDKADSALLELSGKVDKSYVDNKVKTDVPANAVFTDTQVDISGKADTTYVDTELDKKADITYVDAEIASIPEVDISGKADKTYVDTELDKKADASALTDHTGNTSNPHSVTKAQVGLGSYPASPADIGISTATQEALDAKQDKLTFDETPTRYSNNPVKSNGIHNALVEKASHSFVISEVESAMGSAYVYLMGEIEPALESKQNKLTFDDAPIADSDNPVTSGGIYDALTDHTDISDKVDKVAGKGLSTNDYTTTEKTKLENLPKIWIGEEANKGTDDFTLYFCYE